MDELKLEDYPGEDVTACAAFAKKQFKVIQSGYAPPFRSGSKLLLKFCNTECEKFNRKAYTMLDMVKKFEINFILSDTKSVTTHVDYRKYGPILLIPWLQKEHTAFVTDHKWPALASNLPQSNNATKSTSGPGPNKGETQTCCARGTHRLYPLMTVALMKGVHCQLHISAR
jgi:hypothetical protein